MAKKDDFVLKENKLILNSLTLNAWITDKSNSTTDASVTVNTLPLSGGEQQILFSKLLIKLTQKLTNASMIVIFPRKESGFLVVSSNVS